VDALGNPIHLHLTPGNVNDITEAPRLIEASRARYFIADKGYDSQAVVAALEAKKMIPVIPTQADRSYRRKIDRHVYKERHLVENFFCRLKHYRRVATRFEKTATNFLGFVVLASIRIWMA
jgi:transposase